MADERELLDGADFFLSILPPDQAEALASRLAPALQSLAMKPVYVDCNAISPQTAERVAAIVEPTGAVFVDGGIIGGPPREGYSPAIYASGPQAERTAAIARLRHRLADHRRADRRGLGAQDVLCRDHQGHDRDRRGDAARRGALRLRRGADRRIVVVAAARC